MTESNWCLFPLWLLQFTQEYRYLCSHQITFTFTDKSISLVPLLLAWLLTSLCLRNISLSVGIRTARDWTINHSNVSDGLYGDSQSTDDVSCSRLHTMLDNKETVWDLWRDVALQDFCFALPRVQLMRFYVNKIYNGPCIWFRDSVFSLQNVLNMRFNPGLNFCCSVLSTLLMPANKNDWSP